MRSLVAYWRGQGERIVLYLDDGIGGARQLSAALSVSKTCRSDRVRAGFFTNEEKSVWTPSPVVSWLRFVLNFESSRIEIPQRKIEKLKVCLSRAVQSNRVSARALSSIAGQLNAM